MNTDDHPYLECTPALAYFASDVYRMRNLLRMREYRENRFPYLVSVGETDEEIAAVAERVQRRFEATFFSIGGDIFATLRGRDQALAEYEKALAIDPTEQIALNPMWRSGTPER